MKRYHLLILGRVQGVCFRYFTENQAQLLGLTGWVKNLSDGSVETQFQGNEETTRMMIEALHQGPKLSVVKEVFVHEISPQKDERFEIIY